MAMRNKCFWTVVILAIVTLLYSCSNDMDDSEVYSFGLTSATSSNSSEIQTIEKAYYDAFVKNGLKVNSRSFAPGTQIAVVLKSCNEAEEAIGTSKVKFSGRYVYEIRTANKTLYSKVWGVRL